MNHSVSSSAAGKTKVKIVFLGGQSVGKSSIIEKYIHNRFDQSANPTVGIDFLAKNISHKAKNYRLQLWDTAGQERFRSLIPSYLKDAQVALIIFDVTSKNSLIETEMWLNLFNENHGGQGIVFLVGNKIDLDQRQVTTHQGKLKASNYGVSYVQISAKTGQNIEQLFFELIDSAVQKAANNYVLNNQKKQTISKESEIHNEYSHKNIPSGDTSGIKGVGKENVNANENVVLKNEKVVSRGDKTKGCC